MYICIDSHVYCNYMQKCRFGVTRLYCWKQTISPYAVIPDYLYITVDVFASELAVLTDLGFDPNFNLACNTPLFIWILICLNQTYKYPNKLGRGLQGLTKFWLTFGLVTNMTMHFHYITSHPMHLMSLSFCFAGVHIACASVLCCVLCPYHVYRTCIFIQFASLILGM